MESGNPRIFLISGSSGAGKSTVSRLLAERFALGVCIDGDVIAGLVVAGARTPQIEAWSSDTETFDMEVDRQLNLRFRVLGRMAATYAEDGFSVVIDSVFAEPWVSQCVKELGRFETHLVTIQVTRAVRYDRIQARGTGLPVAAFDELVDASLQAQPKDRGLWVDGEHLKPDEIVDLVLHAPDLSLLAL